MPGYMAHLKRLSPEELDREIEGKIAGSYQAVLESDGACAVVTPADAFGWEGAGYEVDDLELTANQCAVEISWQAANAGDGDMAGTAQAVIDDEGNISYREVHAGRG